jgi:hypothetical protein
MGTIVVTAESGGTGAPIATAAVIALIYQLTKDEA